MALNPSEVFVLPKGVEHRRWRRAKCISWWSSQRGRRTPAMRPPRRRGS